MRYLAEQGRIVYLFDSFDEMAQLLRRSTVRDNLRELLSGVTQGSRAIMTSRPTYFESRSERLQLVERDGELLWEEVDRVEAARQASIAQFINGRLEASQYARLNDLTAPQRIALFEAVLADKPAALGQLKSLFTKFQNLESLSQRAVIARLLTSVGEALADPDTQSSVDDVNTVFNESSVFSLVVATLLKRDLGVGDVSAGHRHRWLQAFAVYLQQFGHDSFAAPSEIRDLVRELFANRIRLSDTPQTLEEEIYRTCRRHSGLTTERQYLDTSGNIDSPVDDDDLDSRVGFSHNSLREYLVAEAVVARLLTEDYLHGLRSARFTDAIADFVVDMSENDPRITVNLAERFSRRAESGDDWLFHIVYGFLRRDAGAGSQLLGRPASFNVLDLSGYDLSGLSLRGATFDGCIALDTDLRQSDLRDADFGDSILELVRLDGARIDGARFERADVVSLYVYDEYNTRTTSVLTGLDAAQWLYSHGAYVAGQERLNPLLGRPWYEAAREVAKTLQSRIAGTRQENSLSRGTKLEHRKLAEDFADYLVKAGVLEVVLRDSRGRVVRVVPEHRGTINEFADQGQVPPVLRPFMDKYVTRYVDT